jgi:hypothetical protein
VLSVERVRTSSKLVNHADAALLAAMGEFHEIAERPVAGIDAVTIRYTVTVVLAGPSHI